MLGAVRPLPNTSSWRGVQLSTGQLYLYLTDMSPTEAIDSVSW